MARKCQHPTIFLVKKMLARAFAASSRYMRTEVLPAAQQSIRRAQLVVNDAEHQKMLREFAALSYMERKDTKVDFKNHLALCKLHEGKTVWNSNVYYFLRFPVIPIAYATYIHPEVYIGSLAVSAFSLLMVCVSWDQSVGQYTEDRYAMQKTLEVVKLEQTLSLRPTPPSHEHGEKVKKKQSKKEKIISSGLRKNQHDGLRERNAVEFDATPHPCAPRR